MLTKTDLWTMLNGAWSIARVIEPQGTLFGIAAFTPRADGAFDYLEQGELRLGGGSFAAERRYVFEPRDDGFAVWFQGEPRRLFHELALRVEDGILVGEAVHPCGPDVYVSTYRFDDAGFSIVHRASGPRKSYTLTTTYRRAEATRVAA